MKLNKLTEIQKNKMTMHKLIKYAQVAEIFFQESKLKQKAKKRDQESIKTATNKKKNSKYSLSSTR